MSMDWYEAEQEQAYSEFIDSLAAELYDEHKEQAIAEFVSERLASYYKTHAHMAEDAITFLKKSQSLQDSEPTASLIFSSTVTEVLLKSVLLKPIVYGLVHTESLAELISTVLVKQAGIDRFKELVFGILEHHIHFESGISNYCREGADVPLWKEREGIQVLRNKVLHQAKTCNKYDAERSLGVAMAFINLTNLLLSSIGLKFSKGGLLVSE
ncbi:hypothetical protein SAMN03080615_01358 [Amphritea atlantica]|uniref:RiboL-PSP-HEPN domain-containing protein n=1 Tax=Amphritea atlantica TaxID=355243 RepID=A0A1H9FNS2_9GAMM|nr:hypothetical protein [Amphritea atlantica]SEQ39546.1 hypothetical protein SAMN03080615_01358 [Amphritea atlantica]